MYFFVRILRLNKSARRFAFSIFVMICTPCYGGGCLDLVGSLPEVWDTDLFSDPAQHDAQEYIYSVHAVTGDFAKLLHERKTTELGRIKNMVFASTVTEKRPRTFNSFGVILDFKPDSVVGTSSTDTRSKFPNGRGSKEAEQDLQQSIENYGKRYPVDSPANIIPKKRIEYDENNEQVLLGVSKEGNIVSIKGIFFWGDANGKPLETDVAMRSGLEALREYAKDMHLPVVIFRGKLPRFEDQPFAEKRTNGELTGLTINSSYIREEINFAAEGAERFFTGTRLSQDRVIVDHTLPGYYISLAAKERAASDPKFAQELTSAFRRLKEAGTCDLACEVFFSSLSIR